MNTKGEVWGYSSEEKPDSWNGACDSRAEAIRDGSELYAEPFYVVEGRWIDPAELVDWESVIEGMVDRLRENGPEDAEINVCTGGQLALETALTEWANMYCETECWMQFGQPELVEPLKVDE